ncbi:UDP-2,3-diacylglucosamine diphosphatase [Pelistega sp. MC2]|uniref:UDP-2,3-diacylglucosamine diphosphatase n=1 Tax=Pelistega sp. MC2 TaxID=1720297 RepID=UPI0008DA77D5|nr:UDP-2,3-diacylglucosamine diphosphatase [Pelistega sp. MC2]
MKKLPTLSLSGTLYVASDIHLGPSIPLTNQAFFDFLKKANQEADVLFLLGDVFNAWFGDDLADYSDEPWLRDSINAIAECAQQIPTYFIRGNRDFLVGKKLAKQLNLHILPEQIIVHSDAGHLFMSHGDELCTHDKGYMLMRHLFRWKKLQQLFLRLPLKWRYKIAEYLRNQSKKKHRQKDKLYHQQYDINPTSLEELIRTNPDIDYVIHGHTHKEAIHVINSTDLESGKIRYRYVLSDWDIDHTPQHQGFLIINANGLNFQRLTR